jgi:hypothetical protein
LSKRHTPELVALPIVKSGCSVQEIGRDEPMVGIEPIDIACPS